MDEFRDQLFKGCTRPAMFAGVPMIPFFLTTGLFIALSMYGFYLISPLFPVFAAVIYFPLYFTMRMVTKKDDQRLSQILLRMRMRMRLRGSKAFWGAISYSPLKYRDRSK